MNIWKEQKLSKNVKISLQNRWLICCYILASISKRIASAAATFRVLR